jgi:decaprenyl-phosphate phosphoribosyltransferase
MPLKLDPVDGVQASRVVKGTGKPGLKTYLKALRVRQWTKNLVVFSAPFFAFSLSFNILLNCIAAVFCFCFLSSAFYIVNDILDIKADQLHPIKSQRPIASGLIKIPLAIGIAIFLAGLSLTLGFSLSPNVGYALIGYASLQIFYNLKLKHTVILDVIAIAAGFVLRAYGGAAATNILLSPWFLICTAMLAIFLGVEKRKAELRIAELKGTTRAVLRRYSVALLNRMESTVSTGAILSYAIWSSGPGVNGASTPWMLVTVPYVMYGIFRYQLLSDPQEIMRNNDIAEHQACRTERPEEVLLTDRPILLTVLTWVLTIFVILVSKHYKLIA